MAVRKAPRAGPAHHRRPVLYAPALTATELRVLHRALEHRVKEAPGDRAAGRVLVLLDAFMVAQGVIR
jgi:hypothetical protein